LGKAGPPHTHPDTGVGVSHLAKAVAKVTHMPAKEVEHSLKQAGEIGQGVATLVDSTQTAREQLAPYPASFETLFDLIRELPAIQGKGSVESKAERIAAVIRRCSTPQEADIVARAVIGPKHIRIGASEKLLIAAIAQSARVRGAESVDPSEQREAAAAIFAQRPCFIQLAQLLERSSWDAPRALAQVREQGPALGTPVKPALATAASNVGDAAARCRKWMDDLQTPATGIALEWKLDGERAQIHVETDGEILTRFQVFSRNGEDSTAKFGSLRTKLAVALKTNGPLQAVFDAEAVVLAAESDQTQRQVLPFSEVAKLRRKEWDSDQSSQLGVFLFDVLACNGDCMAKPLSDRLRILQAVVGETPFVRFTPRVTLTRHEQDLERALARAAEDAVARGAEGLMLKPLDGVKQSCYTAGERTWVKLKSDAVGASGGQARLGGDTFDLVPVAAYRGAGRRKAWYGSYLVACWREADEKLVPVARVGSGMADSQLEEFDRSVRQAMREGETQEEPPEWIDMPRSGDRPDVWFRGSVLPLFEVRASEATLSSAYSACLGSEGVPIGRGVSLRFPRLVRLREDKGMRDASSESSVLSLWRNDRC
jgi:DNA ligase 1